MARPDRGTTLIDVARAAGVSRQTVSNAINAPHLLRAETLAQVRSVIDRLGYQPNRSARSLRTRQSRLIGYCVPRPNPDRLGWVLDEFLHAVADAARGAGYHIVVFTPDSAQRELDSYATMLQTGGADGFLLTDITHRDRRPGWLRRRGVPFVSYGRLPASAGPAWVDVDGAAGVAAAVEHLVGLGHRRIAFLGWPEGHRVGDDRADGWRSAMAAHRLAATLRGYTDDTITAAAEEAGRMLDAARPPTAVIAVSDTVAVGALRAARARGLAPGRDLSVVGFDDTPSAALLTPPLTSVSQPLQEAARLLVEMLVARLAGRRPERRSVLLEPTLVVRGSTGPPPPGR
ncbi:LacI family DNA-binding transcriptional regulator [Gandjariella thermophila]|uniref:Alanine racemase n=1 Tax=Gandjariella thermophila TaxID=1931992 RepID=A0A4D4J0T2_9PSEU|nr:LacI family DNA-binding transcriptional regulator [Gandjariella thermophila]GDY28974.1 alanine racemase [Gandjariella thermophila]